MAHVSTEQGLEDYLRERGIDYRRGAGNELYMACFFDCNEGRTSKRKLYINTETWLWDCKVCANRGGRKRLLEHFGDEPEGGFQRIEKDPHTRSEVLGEYVALTEEMLAGNKAMLSYLFDRGLSPETVEGAHLGYVPKGKLVCESLPHALVPGGFTRADLQESGMLTHTGAEFLAGRITIPYLSGEHVVQVRGKDPAGKYVTPAGDRVRLYGSDDLRNADEAIVLEGEFDKLLVTQVLVSCPDSRLRRIAVVGIPGVHALPGGKDGFAEFFRNIKRVYLMFDADDAGRRAALELKSLLGTKSRIVELPDEGLKDSAGEVVKLDATEYLRPKTIDHPYGGHGWRDLSGLLSQADMVGKRLFSVAEAQFQWAQESTAGYIKTGYVTLDNVLGGGLREGDLCIPLAKTGAGKSVFLANLCWNAQQAGVPVMLISLETTSSQVYDILRRLARFHIDPRLEEHEIPGFLPTLRIVQENRLTPEDFHMLVADYEEELEVKPRLVMVDYLGYYARGRPGNGSYERTSDATMQLKAEAKDHRCAVVAPHQVNRGAKDGHIIDVDAARDSGVVEETADWLFGLYRPGDVISAGGVFGSGLNLNFLKGRRGGKGKTVNLAMSGLSLAIVDKANGRAATRVEVENEQYNRGVTYGEWVKSQQAQAYLEGQEQIALAGVG